MRTPSWVIVERATGEPVMETFRADWVARLRTDRFEAVPILEWLAVRLPDMVRQSNPDSAKTQ